MIKPLDLHPSLLRSLLFTPLVLFALPGFSQGVDQKAVQKEEASDERPKGKGNASKKPSQTRQWYIKKVDRKKDAPAETFLQCRDCALDARGLPIKSYSRRLGGPGVSIKDLEVRFDELRFEKLSDKELQALGDRVDSLPSRIDPVKRVSYSRKTPYLEFSFLPLIKDPSGTVKKLVHHEFEVMDVKRGGGASGRSSHFPSQSVLRNGDWYRLGVTETGVHVIDRDLLSSLGVPADSIHPGQIDIYGNGYGMLPFRNDRDRPHDLKRNAISVQAGGDGSFDAGDRIFFYAKGPDVWDQNSLTGHFEFRNHFYTDTSWYFLNVQAGSKERVQQMPKVTDPIDQTVDEVHFRAAHEKALVNLLHSGRQWAGERIQDGNSKTYTFPVGKLAPGSKVHVDFRALSRTLGTSNVSNFQITVNGSTSDNLTIDGVSDYYLDKQGRFNSTELLHTVGSNEKDLKVKVSFQGNTPSSKGWVDHIVVNGTRSLEMEGQQVAFRDTASVGAGQVTRFRFTGSGQVDRIWDVSDPTNVKEVPFDMVGGSPQFRVHTDSLRDFVAFDEDGLPKPHVGGRMEQQNLHAASQPDMVIVSGSDFLPAAEELADFHRQEGMDILVTTPRKIYNEFGGGMRDITAIRDLMRMFYVRAGTDTTLMPDHLLLMGDGSFDNRLPGMDDRWIPTFQSANSINPTSSYSSDDYFGVLDSTEGTVNGDIVDIGIGRLPVKSLGEARSMVDKIKAYAREGVQGGGAHCGAGEFSLTDPNWRDLVVFVADDEDGNLHMQDADGIASKVRNLYPVMNQKKIFLDAYQQTTASGGERYPSVNQAINERIARGALIMNYVGHGGERGWSKERILTQKMIKEWENLPQLPLFLTATCEFTRFDDHSLVSAGENVILNPDGGGIGIFSTTRVVYSGANEKLNKEFYEHALVKENGKPIRFGEIVRRTKKGMSPGSINHRKFLLFGDPALRLNLPRRKVRVDSINASPVGAPMDTIQALSKVSVSGVVLDQSGSVDPNFEGVVHPLVMDKRSTIKTQANDGGSPMSFKAFDSWLHRGKASVKNGKFEFSFVVPKDIAYQYGNGRISLIAQRKGVDAHGYTETFIIGGTDSSARKDDKGPEIDIFMSDKDFVPGGTTDENPLMLAELKDESGINISNSGIGHDIKAVLDEDRSNAVVLNERYRSDLDTYQKGEVKYRYQDLEEGEHSLKVKAWDVHNNPSERTVDFVVANSAELALDHVLNYPNPFTTHTKFFFEHNQACHFLDVRIRIFTVSGKVVETIHRKVRAEGFRSEGIAWDGTDRFGDPLGKGVYVYEMQVKTPDGKKANKFEKLVLLK